MDARRERAQMVSQQLVARGLRDRRVLHAMRTVPRHRFVPLSLRVLAYADCALPIGHEQTISQPYVVACMTAALGLNGDERVLEVGTGSGYQAAILSQLAREVFTIERIPELAEQAKTRLHALGYTSIQVKTGDGSLGWPEMAPFDAILVTAAAPSVPQPLLDQLAVGGRLVVPVGDEWGQSVMRVYRREGEVVYEKLEQVVFVPLIGEYGWDEEWEHTVVIFGNAA